MLIRLVTLMEDRQIEATQVSQRRNSCKEDIPGNDNKRESWLDSLECTYIKMLSRKYSDFLQWLWTKSRIILSGRNNERHLRILTVCQQNQCRNRIWKIFLHKGKRQVNPSLTDTNLSKGRLWQGRVLVSQKKYRKMGIREARFGFVCLVPGRERDCKSGRFATACRYFRKP